MILRVVVLKSVLSSVPADASAQQMFCGMVIGILNDLAENCAILVDEGNLTTNALFEAARSWPIKFRKHVLMLLTLLRTRNRFVKIKPDYPLAKKCAEATCRHCIGIANAKPPAVVITAEPCLCPDSDLKNAPAVAIQDYTISTFHALRRASRVHQLNRGEWEVKAFEREILAPLFANAKLVKIYDKWIAKSILTRDYQQRLLPAANVGDRFRKSLEWIVGVFLAVCTQPVRRLEVYSGVDTRNKDNKEIGIIVAALKAFENDIRNRFNFPSFVLTVKEETRQSRMLHGRYLLTDQIGIAVERGFDLLMDDSAMKDLGLDPVRQARRVEDCLLAYSPDASKVDLLVRTLRDLT